MNLFLRWSRQVGRMFIGTIALLTVSSMATRSTQAKPVSWTSQTTTPVILADNPTVRALAAHLKKVGAKMYGAYWCPYCTRQKELFGEAFQAITYIECDPRGKDAQPDMCRDAGVKGYPTWEINGKTYVGLQSLDELANASSFQGTRKF